MRGFSTSFMGIKPVMRSYGKFNFFSLNEQRVYRAPILYLVIFYSVLLAWTIVSIFLFGIKGWRSWFQLFMIAFIFIFTWYFSLGIFYRIDMGRDGVVGLTSLRRTMKVSPQEIRLIEGPHLPIGFIRFHLEREKVFLFCVMRNKHLQQILSNLRNLNPEIQSRNL